MCVCVCVCVLREKGMHTEGLFRRSASALQVKETKEKINKGVCGCV